MNRVRHPSRLPPRAPLPQRPLGMLGAARAARRNVLELIPEAALRQPMISGSLGRRWHMVMDPGAMRRVFKDNVDNYPKSGITRALLEPAIGQGMLIAEGAHWRWQRRAAAPAFSPRSVESLAPMMTAAAEWATERIGAAKGPLDIYAEMITGTFRVIADVIFSDSADVDPEVIIGGVERYIARAARISLLDLMELPAWIPRPGRIIGTAQLRQTRRLVDRAIAARAETGPRLPPDLLDLLRAGQDPETGRSMTPAELRDNLLTLIVAGHETTALTLGWSLWLLGFDPEAQQRVADEAQAVLGGRAATAADLPRLPFTLQVVNEALRLYPPVAFMSRTAQAPDTLAGCAISAGDTVMLPIYALHRHQMLWDRPDAFDPDRFAPGRGPVDRYAYLPFGAGPRVCIGASFGLQEAVIVLATLTGRFRFRTVPGRVPQPHLFVTLRPEGGAWLTATPR